MSPSSSSHSLLSEKVGTNQDSTGLPSVEQRSDKEPEPKVPYINLEPEEGEEMALRLAANFKERQRKRLFETLPTPPFLLRRVV